jgi:NAD(P)-dependent dehydrogenase (short-subunit alcohol dehydrogenase family)
MEVPSKTWFITGVSGGFGKALAEAVIRSGSFVVGTFRNANQAQEFEKNFPGKAKGLLLDLNDSASIKPALEEALRAFGSIDVLVNNAGYGLVGAIEEIAPEEIRLQMETNFFAAFFVTQQLLPYFRKQGHGTIVQISSQAGIHAAAGFGAYNASKFALEGFSEALAKETAHLGIRVIIVEPGPFRTKWAGNALISKTDEIADYKTTSGVARERIHNSKGMQPGDPVKGSQVIIDAVKSQSPPLRLVLGKIALESVRSKLNQVARDLNEWESQTISADY